MPKRRRFPSKPAPRSTDPRVAERASRDPKWALRNALFNRFGHGRCSDQSRLPSHVCSATFGRMFPGLARRRRCVLRFSSDNSDRLERLGFEVGQKGSGSATADSTIPAGYTYWGQFIDHDITFDPTSSLTSSNRPSAVQNFRTPCLDLDSVYGQGPAASPHLYDQLPQGAPDSGAALLLGSNQPSGNGGPGSSPNPPVDFDVPRNEQFTALLGDPRNDENLIVSQLHHAYLKFHNKVVDHVLTTDPGADPFQKARDLVRHHHQFAIRMDFLPTICRQDVVNRVFSNGPSYFRQRVLRMPVEFAVGAYRFGHSMIRDNYGVNDNFPNATLGQVFAFIRRPLIPVLSNWVIDFNRFFPTGSPKPVNMARPIDTELALGLNALPNEGAGLMSQLASRNLVRGLAFKLPSGQCVARRLGLTPLSQAELLQGATTAEEAILKEKSRQLLKKTPLWYYILKEAEVAEGGNRLGRVGSTIVAEVFYRILKDDAGSYLNVSGGFSPSLPQRTPGTYTIIDLLEFAGVL